MKNLETVGYVSKKTAEVREAAPDVSLSDAMLLYAMPCYAHIHE